MTMIIRPIGSGHCRRTSRTFTYADENCRRGGGRRRTAGGRRGGVPVLAAPAGRRHVDPGRRSADRRRGHLREHEPHGSELHIGCRYGNFGTFWQAELYRRHRPATAGRSPPAAPPTSQQSSPNASGQITFYGAADNDPPGSRDIAYPGVLHGQAGGTGTFEDPITFAAQDGRFAPGTKIYVPDVRRYFILEDSCASCSGSHIDLWTGSANDRGIVRCEDSLTRNGSRPYQLNPPAGLAVSPGDLYQNGHCFRG
ncbi:hypothetical protein [Kutzneria chonburiensis]|uniref:hypothetical protein n=1 Tax=Kutzneria chonburiensis TaxID=1483604 RepID=UPI0023611416|nr:hypothetical protein [Kutzneria chonburiensis]